MPGCAVCLYVLVCLCVCVCVYVCVPVCVWMGLRKSTCVCGCRKCVCVCDCVLCLCSPAQVTESMLKVLTCRTVEGVQLLSFYPSVVCQSAEHLPLLVLAAILLVAFMAGCPIFMVWFYHRCVCVCISENG